MNQGPMLLSWPGTWTAAPSRTLVVVGVAVPPPGTLPILRVRTETVAG